MERYKPAWLDPGIVWWTDFRYEQSFEETGDTKIQTFLFLQYKYFHGARAQETIEIITWPESSANS